MGLDIAIPWTLSVGKPPVVFQVAEAYLTGISDENIYFAKVGQNFGNSFLYLLRVGHL